MQAAANPHDRFFKQVLSNPQVARDFVQNYLPASMVAHLDLDTLTISTESFVDGVLQAHHTDLLFTVKQQNGEDSLVHLLFEHKSYVGQLVLALI